MSSDSIGDPILRISSASKQYGIRTVLNRVSLEIDKGSAHGLIGPNGSGKSTLLKCLVGAETLSSGSILFKGNRIDRWSPRKRITAGIGVKFQHAQVIPQLTVAENIIAASNAKRSFGRWVARAAAINAGQMADLERLGLAQFLQVNATDLSHGQQQWLELAMSLASEPDLLLLDEPTAGMNDAERGQTESALGEFRARGISILLIDHDLDFVKRFCDSLTVLHNGDLVASGSTHDVAAIDTVREAYLGIRAIHE